MSFLLSRFLEQYGVWNYVVVGGLIVSAAGRATKKIFYPEESDSKSLYGHAWVRVPPFRFVDLTLPLQEYSSDLNGVVTEPVLSELVRDEGFPADFAEYGHPNVDRFCPSFVVTHGNATLLYVPYGVKLPSENLESMAQPVLHGLNSYQLFSEFRDMHPEALFRVEVENPRRCE
jgi:hypothetical protein